jgi:nitroreductase
MNDLSVTVRMSPEIMGREAEYPLDPLFIGRWSPRAFTGEPIHERDLYTAFEAARWAPSSLNYQPWRFVFAHRDSHRFDEFLGLLDERNQLWAHKASALIFVLSDNLVVYRGNLYPSPSHEFDTGAAWASFALQAHLLGYGTRAIGGFDRELAPEVLGAGDRYQVHCAIAIGVPDEARSLPETLSSLEKPSDRRPLAEIVFEDHLATL